MGSRYSIPLHDRFVPVPVRARHDGWTVKRQRGFILALTQGSSVPAAAERVGMSARSAYRLHDRTHAGSFRRAWAAAQNLGAPEPQPSRPVHWIKLHLYAGRVVHREECWDEVAVRRVITKGDPYAFSRREDTAEVLAVGRRLRAECYARCLDAVQRSSRQVLQPRWSCNRAVREVCDLSDRRGGGGGRRASSRTVRAPP